MIFPKKWPRLRRISWPVARIKSGFMASRLYNKLKHKMPQVRFMQHNVAISSLLGKSVIGTSHVRFRSQYKDKYGHEMLQNDSSCVFAA